MASYLTDTDSSGLLDSTLCFHLILLMCVVSNLFHHRTLSAPVHRSDCRPQGGAKGRGSRRMFWELGLGDVIGKPVELQCPKIVVQPKAVFSCAMTLMDKIRG